MKQVYFDITIFFYKTKQITLRLFKLFNKVKNLICSISLSIEAYFDTALNSFNPKNKKAEGHTPDCDSYLLSRAFKGVELPGRGKVSPDLV